MRVLVDTCIWSLALRRKNNQTIHQQAIVEKLRYLIDEQQVVMLGVIRQEILSGIQHQEQFERIRNKLRLFPDYPITTTDFETAAEFFNRCRMIALQFLGHIFNRGQKVCHENRSKQKQKPLYPGM